MADPDVEKQGGIYTSDSEYPKNATTGRGFSYDEYYSRATVVMIKIHTNTYNLQSYELRIIADEFMKRYKKLYDKDRF